MLENFDWVSVIFWIIGFFVFVGLGVGALFWFYKSKSKKKYPFILYNADGSKNREIFAVLSTDEFNRDVVQFEFPQDFPKAVLLVKPPSFWVDGKGYREIIQNDLGELSYVEKRINKDKYLELNIMPEEKSIAMSRMRGYSERYQRDVTKWQAFTLGAIVIMFFIGIVGAGYVFTSTYKASDNLIVVSQQTKDSTRAIQTTSEVLNDLVGRLIVMQGEIDSDKRGGERVIT